jgi:ankyrin repeat protein
MKIFSNSKTTSNPPLRKLKLLSVASICLLTTAISFAHDGDMNPSEEAVSILSEGNLTKVELLLNGGININDDLIGDGTPLIIAVQNNKKKLVEYLLGQGADINQKSVQDGSPLIVASLTNNIELVEYLHKQGASIDAVTEYDETALISASRAGNFQIVKFLVEQGADINLAVEAKTLKGSELRSPLNGAKTIAIRDYLIANGARS